MISIEKLSLFAGTAQITSAVSLSLEPNEKVVLTGASGCGKSSILRAIPGGFEKWTGAITVAGTTLTPRTAAKVRSHIAYIPQEPQLPEGTVEEYFRTVSHFSGNRGNHGNGADRKRLMDQLLLPQSILQKECSLISGGERQRTAIVASLLLNRPILLADEITSALDEKSKAAVLDLLFSLNCTMLSVAHDPLWIDRCDRAVEIRKEEI